MNNISPEDISLFKSVTCQDDNKARIFLLRYPDVSTAIAQYFLAQEANPAPAVENSQVKNSQPPEPIKLSVSNFVRRSRTEVPAKSSFFNSQGNSQEPQKPKIFELNPDESSLSASLPEESEIEEEDEDEDFDLEEENLPERNFMKPTQELTLPPVQAQGGNSPVINDNVAQFIAITDCDKKTAQDYLNRFRDLDIAMDAFFNKASAELSMPYPQKSFSTEKESSFQPIKGSIWQPAQPTNTPSFIQPNKSFANFPARPGGRGRRNRSNQYNAPVQIGGSRLKANLPLKLRGGDYKEYVKKYTKPGQPLNEAHQWPKYLGSLLVDCTINTQETLSNIKINDELKFAPEDIEFTATNIKKKKKNKDGQTTTEVVGKNWYIKGTSLMVQCLWKGRMVGYLSCDFEEIFVFLLSKNYIFLEGTVVHNSFNAGSPLSAYFNTVTAQIDVFLTDEVLKNPLNIISVPGRKPGARARKQQNDGDEIQTKEQQQLYQTLRLAKESFVKLFAMLKINVAIPTIVQLRQRIDPFQRIKREKYGLNSRRGRRAYMRMGVPAESIPTDFPDYYKNSHNNGLAANIAPNNPLALSDSESDFDEEDDDDLDWNQNDGLSDSSDTNPWKKFTKPNKSSLTTEISMTKPMETEAKEPGDEENNKANQDLLGNANQAASYYVASEPPETLKSELHPYQKQALSWMKHREGQLGRDELFESTFEEQRLLNDLFQEMILLDGSKLYFNPFNGEICVDFPTVKTCKGGILADEMGLGKTVMTIALIHSHKRASNNLGTVQEEVEDDDDEEEDSEETLTKAKDPEDDEGDFVPKTVEKKKTVRRRGRGRRGKESSDDEEEEDEIPTAKKITRSNSNKEPTIKDFFQKSKTAVDVGSKRGAPKDLDFDDFFSDEDEENDFSSDAKSAVKGSTKKLKDNNNKGKVTNNKKESLMGLWALDDDDDDFTPKKKRERSVPSTKKDPAKSTSSTDKKKTVKRPRKKAAPKKIVTKKYTGTLIVVPLTVLPQWETEIQKHSNPDTVTVLQYYGNARRNVNFQDYDVILTTYGILESEYTDYLTKKKESQLFSCEWFRVILDEAHYIKGRQTKTTKAAHALASDYRWCLTGTPLQNKLDDMFSLLQFLRLDTWGEYFWWNTYINKYTSHDEAAKLIRGILKPVILRRTKKSTYLDGTNILELPKKEINNVFVKLTHEERAIYNGFFQGSKKQFNEMVSSGTLQYEYAHVFELLIRLRQVCDHPSMVFTKDDLKNKENLDKAIYKFLEKRMQSSLANNPAFKDKPKKSDEIEEEKGDNSMMKSEFITKTIERLKNKELEPCCICLEEITNAAIANCGHIFCKDCLTQSLKTTKKCPLCQNEITVGDVMSISLADQEQSKSLLDINSSNFKKSSKLDAVINAAKEVAQKGEKVVIFSQFISMLGLIERFLKEEKIGYRRIDGSTTMKARADNIEAFNQDPEVTVFLISLKAGAIGLNLTVAQNVYLVDPWWNPAVEDQAIERVHRIGQRNQVQVKRFVCEKTIEERILQLNAKKKELINRILQFNPLEQKKQNMENMIYVMQGFDDE